MPIPPRALARLGLVAALTTLLSITSSAASAAGSKGEPTVGGVLYDALIERPMGVAETALGLAITPIAYPLSLGSGRSAQVIQHCVRQPARYTFARSLGRFDDRPPSRCGPVGLTWSVAQIGLGVLARPLDMVFGRSPLGGEATPGPKDEIEI